VKAKRITIRPLRKMLAVLPTDLGNETVLLLRVDEAGRVVERMLFDNHVESFRTCVHGFTHYARLPFYLSKP
jgi:hypothetical protein